MTENNDISKYVNVLLRRLPNYEYLKEQWDFYEVTYDGGRDWFDLGNIFHYYKEGEVEYEDRVQRAYRFNHSKEIVDIINKYIFKSSIARSEILLYLVGYGL
jgi:hypothetical protein